MILIPQPFRLASTCSMVRDPRVPCTAADEKTSKPYYFKDRCISVGLTDEHHEAIVAQGINSMRKLACSCNYHPQNSDDTPFVPWLRV
eukprot:256929-Amphidinium_carterae.1